MPYPYYLFFNKNTNGRPTNEQRAHQLKVDSIPMISDSFPARRIMVELSIKLIVIYKPFAIEGKVNPFFWIKARMTGVLEKAESPKNSKEIIKSHPLEWMKSSIRRGVEAVRITNIFLQPILSESVPDINTPAIAAA